MRLIDADKLKPDCMTKDGRFAISQSQIANAKPIQTSTDAVSRQAVLEGLAIIAKVKARSDAQKSLMGRVMFFVEQLPFVTPTRPKGKWEDVNSDGSLWRCSVCQDTACCNGNYCPNCGARMKEGEA